MFVTSAYAGTTKKGYVFSDHPTYIWEFRNRTKGRDFAGAMRLINEKKVYPLKEGLDVVIVEVIQGGIVRFRLRSTPGSLVASQLDANRTPIADALAQTHEEREAATRSQLEQAAHNWALAAAQAQPQVPTATAFAAVMTGIAKLYGWDRPGQTLTINSDKTVFVCDEARRDELIKQRQRILTEQPVTVRTTETGAT